MFILVFLAAVLKLSTEQNSCCIVFGQELLLTYTLNKS